MDTAHTYRPVVSCRGRDSGRGNSFSPWRSTLGSRLRKPNAAVLLGLRMSPDPRKKAGAACGRGGSGLVVVVRGDVPVVARGRPAGAQDGERKGRLSCASSSTLPLCESCCAVVGVGGVWLVLEQPESGFPGSRTAAESSPALAVEICVESCRARGEQDAGAAEELAAERPGRKPAGVALTLRCWRTRVGGLRLRGPAFLQEAACRQGLSRQNTA